MSPADASSVVSVAAAVGAALVAAAAAISPNLALCTAGWVFAICGASLLLHGRQPPVDALLVIDFAHALLSLVTLPHPLLKPEQLRDLHCAYHAVFVSLTAVLDKPALKSNAFRVYFIGSWLQLLAGLWFIWVDYDLKATADEQSVTGADTLTTPWHWCLYLLLGGADFAYPVVMYVAYKGIIALAKYPQGMVPAVRQTLSTVTSQPTSVRMLVVLVPLVNNAVMWLCITPRIIRFLKHSAALAEKASARLDTQKPAAKRA